MSEKSAPPDNEQPKKPEGGGEKGKFLTLRAGEIKVLGIGAGIVGFVSAVASLVTLYVHGSTAIVLWSIGIAVAAAVAAIAVTRYAQVKIQLTLAVLLAGSLVLVIVAVIGTALFTRSPSAPQAQPTPAPTASSVTSSASEVSTPVATSSTKTMPSPSPSPSSPTVAPSPCGADKRAAGKNPFAMLADPSGDPAFTVAFRPGGEEVAVGSLNANYSVYPPTNLGGGLYLWETECASLAGQDHYVALHDPGSQGICQVAFSPNGTLLAAADGNHTTYLWNVAGRTPVLLARFLDPESTDVAGMAFGPGDTLLTADVYGGAYSWRIPSPAASPVTVRVPAFTFPRQGRNGLNVLAVSPKLTVLALGYSNGRTYLYNLPGDSFITSLLDPKTQGVTSLAFGRQDGTILAAGDNSGLTYLWNLTGGGRLIGPLLSTITQQVKTVAFNPAGTIAVTGDNDGYVFVWNVAKRTLITRFRYPGEESVFSVAFSPDGATIAVGDYSHNTSLWRTDPLLTSR